ncbi:MAG: Hsp20/alpha crystallin family protein [Myxococcota bacterium]|nr:Hsp20/alpha crystallin family protein [Myxococcota bacterium]
MATTRERRDPHPTRETRSQAQGSIAPEPSAELVSRLEDFPAAEEVGLRPARPAGGYAPRRIDITETDADFHIRAELPELTEDDFVVEVDGSMLCIRGEQPTRQEPRGSARRGAASRCRSFSRSFSLPRSADPEDVSTEYHDGVLDVTVGKRPPARP